MPPQLLATFQCEVPGAGAVSPLHTLSSNRQSSPFLLEDVLANPHQPRAAPARGRNRSLSLIWSVTSPDLLILPRSDGCSWKPQRVPTAGQPSTLLPSSGSTEQLGELGCTPLKEPVVLNRSSVGFGETARGRALGLNRGRVKPSPRGLPTLVEVGERFVVELHRRGRGRAQHVLEGQNFVLVLRRQT